MATDDSPTQRNDKMAMLAGYPESVCTAYVRFRAHPNAQDLVHVVFGSLAFLLSTKPSTPLEEMPDTAQLQVDIGADSLAITELVFLLEGLFDIAIKNEEIAGIKTLGDLRGFVLNKVPMNPLA